MSFRSVRLPNNILDPLFPSGKKARIETPSLELTEIAANDIVLMESQQLSSELLGKLRDDTGGEDVGQSHHVVEGFIVMPDRSFVCVRQS